ncbi:hypothetical protein [Bacillus inaquosorum]
MIRFHKVEGKRAGKAGAENWRKVVTKGFDLHHIGFNTKPFIFRKREDEKPGVILSPKYRK